jgi:polyferredoxin
MERIGKPRGLIRYASLNGIERGEPLRVTPRLVGYTVVLLALIGVFLYLLFTRNDVETTLLRAPGALFQEMPDGRLSNLYVVKMLNKTHEEVTAELRLEGIEGRLQVLGRPLRVGGGEQGEASVLIELEASRLSGGKTPVEIGVYVGGRQIDVLRTVFIGPRRLSDSQR